MQVRVICQELKKKVINSDYIPPKSGKLVDLIGEYFCQMERNRIGIEMNLQQRKQVLLIEGCHVDRKTVYNWIKNKTQPNIFQFKKISALLGVSMEELVDLDEEKEEDYGI